MEKSKKWGNPQSVLVMSIIFILLIYMSVDFFIVTPQLKTQVEQVSVQYDELNEYLDTKIPEIDSTLKTQSLQIGKQTTEIQGLKTVIKDIKTP